MKKKQGFATLSPDRMEEIASQGGRKVSTNREHMREIGRRGGIASGEAKRQKKVLVDDDHLPNLGRVVSQEEVDRSMENITK